jgi:hypothetical protein
MSDILPANLKRADTQHTMPSRQEKANKQSSKFVVDEHNESIAIYFLDRIFKYKRSNWMDMERHGCSRTISRQVEHERTWASITIDRFDILFIDLQLEIIHKKNIPKKN